MKPMNLSAKEIRRADGNLTVVVRPQVGGLFMVAAVSLLSGLPIFKPSYVAGGEISVAVRNELRMACKCGWRSSMAEASRHRVRV
jgi:hypothetical protein